MKVITHTNDSVFTKQYMKLPKIVTNKDQLHRPTKPVSTLEEGIEIANQLITVLGSMKFGIGLSANQIGIPKSVSIVRLENEEPLILINPTVIEYSPEKVIYKEGCLSIPGKAVTTMRSSKIIVGTLNHANPLPFGADVNPVTNSSINTDKGLLKAICVQHEIDHLNGRLMIDDGIRVIIPPTKAGVKHGRNDKVMIQKDEETKYIKYKQALSLVQNEGWKLL
jgi:peptide deformylase